MGVQNVNKYVERLCFWPAGKGSSLYTHLLYSLQYNTIYSYDPRSSFNVHISYNVYMHGSSHIARVRVNRVRLPILLVVS